MLGAAAEVAVPRMLAAVAVEQAVAAHPIVRRFVSRWMRDPNRGRRRAEHRRRRGSPTATRVESRAGSVLPVGDAGAKPLGQP